ncbi:uncharacterized protein LOC105839357 [Monomorium pharaonis]|uniref:uncharacterized protein LOC105839357 n=1 Tax=Monomorium pharaonis TaxID=307658 RepID=UPI001745E22A|nr:uncharacterized protein LOC105839357 [Monomorium pharaonis]
MYLKNKVFSKSAAYRIPKTFQFGQAGCVCRFCKKTFCCTKCRNRHVNQMHPNVNVDCALCASETLPVRHFESAKLNLEDEKLLCHIVEKHLPLRCRLCGDLFESRENFKSIAACKWYERWHCLISPIDYEHLDRKLKQCSISESDYNGSRFCTPPEIYRKTSTPMFIGEKTDFETPCVPKFNLITPQNSLSVAQIASISKTSQTSDTQFFSFSLYSSNEETPFRTSKDEQFLRSNSGRKLTIMEEQEKTPDKEAERIIPNIPKIMSPVDMDLTQPEGSILPLQDSSQSNDIREDIVKKVRFSDQYTTATEIQNLMESCMQTVLNVEQEEEEFRDTHDKSSAQKVTAKDTVKDAKNTVDTNIKDARGTSTVEDDKKNINDSHRSEDEKSSLTQTSENFLDNSQFKIIQDNTKNVKKENGDPEENNEGPASTNQRDSNRVLMMVLMETNSGGLTTDLMPLISTGLKKLQEQLITANCQSSSSTTESAKICRRSITTMKMSVSSVESYSTNSAETIANYEQLPSSSSSSSIVRNNESSNSGFLSAVTQAMKHAFRSLSVSGFRIPPRSVGAIQGQEVVEELTSSQESSNGDASSVPVRPGKRAREIIEMPSKEERIAFMSDMRSPLAKRQRGWYKMIRGRQPIKRMRSHVPTSPKGVSAERQVFSQGSLTAGDTVLPLPARAHQSTE